MQPGENGLESVTSQPATSLIVLGCSALWFYLWNYEIPASDFAYNYNKIVVEHQWWRNVSSSFAHLAVWHVFFNMYSLWSFGSLEQMYGTMMYLKWTYLLLVGSMLLHTFFSYVMIYHLRNESYRTGWSLGYSCVVFGLMAVSTGFSKGGSWNIFGVPVPMWAAPWASLAITQLIVPNASFMGHLSGILVGYTVALGLFDWFSNFLFISTLIWSIIGLVWNVKVTTNIPCSWIELPRSAEERRHLSRLNSAGELEYLDPSHVSIEGMELDHPQNRSRATLTDIV